MLTTLMNLEVLVEHILDVGLAMLEDEPSLFHAQNARTGAKGFHRCDDVTLPLDVHKDQRSNMINRETHATGVVRDVHVVNKVRRKSGCRHIVTIGSLLSDLEMTTSRSTEASLQARLRLSDVDLIAMPARSLTDGAVLVAIAAIYALAVITKTAARPAIAIAIGGILGVDAVHHFSS